MVAAAFVACGPSVDCPTPDTVVVDGSDPLRCVDLDEVVSWVRAEAGRPLARGDTHRIRRSVVDAWNADPVGTRRRMVRATTVAADLAAASGLDGGRLRATRLYATAHGVGPFDAGADGVFGAWQAAVHVWAEHAGDAMAIGEADVEGWISFASLCREVQGGGPLRLSVADRVIVYRLVTDRFAAGSTSDRAALASLGPVWPALADAWQAASYERQQRFVQRAPLPPPMTASSLGYVEALTAGDVAGLASRFHDAMHP